MDKLLLKSQDAAEILGISRTHLYQLTATGEIGPRPIKLGKCSLWNALELRDWAAAGCPTREQWLRIRAGEKKDEENRD